MMTRKHFEAIAAVLKASNADPDLIRGMCDVLASTNPRFDRQRFIDASSPSVEAWIEELKAAATDQLGNV